LFIERYLFRFGIVVDITEHIIFKTPENKKTEGIEINGKIFKDFEGFQTGTKLSNKTYKRIRDHTLEQFMFYARSKIRDGYIVSIEEVEPKYSEYHRKFNDYSLCRKYVFAYRKYLEDCIESSHSEIWYNTSYPELERIVDHMKTLIEIINEDLEAKINLYSEDLVIVG